MDSFLKVELKEQEENVDNWVLCTFSDNETDQGGDGEGEMILPDDNDRDDDNVVGAQGNANLNYFQPQPLLLQNNNNVLPASAYTLVPSTLPVAPGGQFQILPGPLTTFQLVPSAILGQPSVTNQFNYSPQQGVSYLTSNSTNNQFITETETTEAFLPSHYSTGGNLPAESWAQHSTMASSFVQTAQASIIRPPPPSIIRPLPTPSVQPFTVRKLMYFK